MKQNWCFPAEIDSKVVQELATTLQLPLPLASILIQRGYDSVEKAQHFLAPRLADLQPPEKIPGMVAAVARLKEALFKKEKIVLYGDYDVDGITSLALLTRLLRSLGGQASCFIPERMSEGYGLSTAGVRRCLQTTQPDLLLAIDCGTNSLTEAQEIKAQGIDLIIIDHHELAAVTAEEACVALVNPQKEYPQSTVAAIDNVVPMQATLQQSKLKDEVKNKSEKLDISTSTGDLNCHEESMPLTPDFSSTSATLNASSKQKVEYYYLCSVGLVFKLAHALLKTYPERPVDLRHYLDLVALGTVADIMPLVGENRILVAHGLRQLAVSRWPGISALMDVTDVKAPLTAFDIGYKLGPRINAAGRLSSALESLELLLTDDLIKAANIARNLDRRNRERQAIERAVTLQAEEMATAIFAINSPKTIVLGRRDWHHGVVGIVASRLSKRWHRPTLIIGFDEEGRGKGSGRSIEGFSLVQALEECSHLLEAFGGHAMAAGITLQQENLEEFREVFEQTAATFLNEEDLVPRLKIDAEVDLKELDEVWLKEQERLGPFGVANPCPLLMARALHPAGEPRLLKEKHLRFEFRGAHHSLLTAIFFNGAMASLPRLPWDVAFTLERNSYKGRSTLQMQIVALRESVVA